MNGSKLKGQMLEHANLGRMSPVLCNPLQLNVQTAFKS